MCLLLVWRVCDQEFGRYMPMKGAEKWSRNHKNWNFTYRYTYKKIHWFQKCYSFRSTTKSNEAIAEKSVLEQWRHQSLNNCERLAVLNRRSSSIHPSSIVMISVLLLWHWYYPFRIFFIKVVMHLSWKCLGVVLSLGWHRLVNIHGSLLGGPTKVKPTYIFVCKIWIKFEWIDKIQWFLVNAITVHSHTLGSIKI